MKLDGQILQFAVFVGPHVFKICIGYCTIGEGLLTFVVQLWWPDDLASFAGTDFDEHIRPQATFLVDNSGAPIRLDYVVCSFASTSVLPFLC
mgnify:CR=1 FL=1